MKQPLDEALDAWDDARSGLVAEIENLPEDALFAPPAEGARAPAEMARHIVESSEMWSRELSRREGDFTRQGFAEFIAEHAADLPATDDRASLVSLLRDTHARGAARLREAAGMVSREPIRAFDGSEMSRIAWLHHGIAHEMYHRGQIALSARIAGVTPALTRRIGG